MVQVALQSQNRFRMREIAERRQRERQDDQRRKREAQGRHHQRMQGVPGNLEGEEVRAVVEPLVADRERDQAAMAAPTRI